MTSSFFKRDPRNWRVAFSPSTAGRVFGEDAEPAAAGEAFLIRRDPEGTWRNVFRLEPGKVMTVGRETMNRLVIEDDRCSRRHCEFIFDVDKWFMRDLKSRNGTSLNGKKAHGDNPLSDGDRVRIGNTILLFTTDLSTPLTDEDPSEDDSGAPVEIHEDESPEPQILERKAHTGYITGPGISEEADTSLRDAFALLCRLSMEMVSANSVKSLAKTILDTLLATIGADIGAVLLFPDPAAEELTPEQLRLIGYQAPDNTPYHLVSHRLSRIVLREREAILAMDISNADGGDQFRTLGEIKAESVICAPIRQGDLIFGLLHLYSLDARHSLDADALDFALAVADQAAVALENILHKESLTTGLRAVYTENKSLRRLLEVESELVGDSDAMRQLSDTIARVSTANATALIRGESGVGKELVARAIHFNSNRRDCPFVCLNCAALTESLLESELFGHERGSFTGATEQKIGKFEQSDGGTLFLDEVGEMPLSIQAKFLRVLEGHPFERVGGSTSVQADVRVVAATNRNLESAVERGKFRRDLFFRLQILEVEVPSLREHADDIPALVEHFLLRSCERMGREGLGMSDEALDVLTKYDWPGNIRELRNLIERAVVLAEDHVIRPIDIRFSSLSGSPDSKSSSDVFEPIALEQVERGHILQMLDYTQGKKREAARLLGINRSTLDRKLERYGIEAQSSDE